MTFSAISDSVSSFYSISTMQCNWLSIVFMVTTIVLAVPAMWLLDNRGFQVAFILPALLNGVGAALRIVSAISAVPRAYQYTILMAGQTLAGCAQPFILFAPTKLAAQWFSPGQRTFANMIGSTANPIGIMLGNVLSAVIVPDDSIATTRIPLLLEVFAAPAFLGVAMSLFVCSSLPPTPPSSSAAEEQEPFFQGIKKLLHNRSYLILALCYGGGMGLLSTLVTILNQLLCPTGYTDSFIGLCGGLLFGVGLFGAMVFAIIVDRIRKYEEAAKIGFAVCACVLIAFMIIMVYPNQNYVLAVLCGCVGFFGLALNPICLELSVESSFPVSEGTSAGFLVLSGQIQAAAYTLLMTVNATEVTFCSTGSVIISSYAVLGFIVVIGVLTILFVVGYRCDYKRLQFEQQLSAEIICSSFERRMQSSDPLLS